MSSAESSSAGSSSKPAAVAYSQAREPQGTRFGAPVVVLIIALIVVIAAGITAAVVLTRKQAPTEPRTPKPRGDLVQPAAAPVASTVRDDTRLALMATGSPMRTEVTYSAAAGEQIELVEGVSLTVPDGWEVTDKGDGGVAVANKYDVGLIVYIPQFKSKDAEEVLSDMMTSLLDPQSGLSNSKVGKVGSGTIQGGKNFQRLASQTFSFDAVSQVGTLTVLGDCTALVNISTGLVAELLTVAPGPGWDTYVAAAADVNSMIDSMV